MNSPTTTTPPSPSTRKKRNGPPWSSRLQQRVYIAAAVHLQYISRCTPPITLQTRRASHSFPPGQLPCRIIHHSRSYLVFIPKSDLTNQHSSTTRISFPLPPICYRCGLCCWCRKG